MSAPEIGTVRKEEWTPTLGLMYAAALLTSASVVFYAALIIWAVVT